MIIQYDCASATHDKIGSIIIQNRKLIMLVFIWLVTKCWQIGQYCFASISSKKEEHFLNESWYAAVGLTFPSSELDLFSLCAVRFVLDLYLCRLTFLHSLVVTLRPQVLVTKTPSPPVMIGFIFLGANFLLQQCGIVLKLSDAKWLWLWLCALTL